MLGIDPGSLNCGYGMVGTDGKNTYYITSGKISVPPSKPLQYRLKYIFEALVDAIRQHRPDNIVVEKIFFAKGAQAALSLGHARGVALLAAASEDIPVYEFSALEVKKAVVGYGRAEKKQVQEMIKIILNIKGTLYPDSADALALAVCHLHTIKLKRALNASK